MRVAGSRLVLERRIFIARRGSARGGDRFGGPRGEPLRAEAYGCVEDRAFCEVRCWIAIAPSLRLGLLIEQQARALR